MNEVIDPTRIILGSLHVVPPTVEGSPSMGPLVIALLAERLPDGMLYAGGDAKTMTVQADGEAFARHVREKGGIIPACREAVWVEAFRPIKELINHPHVIPLEPAMAKRLDEVDWELMLGSPAPSAAPNWEGK